MSQRSILACFSFKNGLRATAGALRKDYSENEFDDFIHGVADYILSLVNCLFRDNSLCSEPAYSVSEQPEGQFVIRKQAIDYFGLRNTSSPDTVEYYVLPGSHDTRQEARSLMTTIPPVYISTQLLEYGENATGTSADIALANPQPPLSDRMAADIEQDILHLMSLSNLATSMGLQQLYRENAHITVHDIRIKRAVPYGKRAFARVVRSAPSEGLSIDIYIDGGLVLNRLFYGATLIHELIHARQNLDLGVTIGELKDGLGVSHHDVYKLYRLEREYDAYCTTARVLREIAQSGEEVGGCIENSSIQDDTTNKLYKSMSRGIGQQMKEGLEQQARLSIVSKSRAVLSEPPSASQDDPGLEVLVILEAWKARGLENRSALYSLKNLLARLGAWNAVGAGLNIDITAVLADADA